MQANLRRAITETVRLENLKLRFFFQPCYVNIVNYYFIHTTMGCKLL
jgi:hypothetical protein